MEIAIRAADTVWEIPAAAVGRGPQRILIAGGGVAGIEALLVLWHLAGDGVRLTLLSPEAEFASRPPAVAEWLDPRRDNARLAARIAEGLGAELIRGALREVDSDRRTVITTTGQHVAYDALLVAVGACRRPALRGVLTWTSESDAQLFGGLLRDVDQGYTKRVAFVVPTGVRWTQPAYELALRTARQAWENCHDDVRVTVYTPEEAPVEALGKRASTAMRDKLHSGGVRIQTGVHVSEDSRLPGRLVLHPEGRHLDAERVVALPRTVGPQLRGLPADAAGFIPTDARGRVPDAGPVWAAGDAISFPVKAEGLAAQQAEAAAESIAAHLGVHPRPRSLTVVPA